MKYYEHQEIRHAMNIWVMNVCFPFHKNDILQGDSLSCNISLIVE